MKISFDFHLTSGTSVLNFFFSNWGKTFFTDVDSLMSFSESGSTPIAGIFGLVCEQIKRNTSGNMPTQQSGGSVVN